MINIIKKSILISFFALSANVLFSQDIDHWESVILNGDECKYFIPSSEIGDNWKNQSFDDNSWTTAASGIGYGDGDDNTLVPDFTQSVYIRYRFNISDITKISSVLLDFDFDDGFVAYLNGTEIARSNVNDPITWNMTLAIDHEARMHSGGKPDRFNLDYILGGLLTNGENVLAVEVHNRNNTSSDLSSNLFLHTGINDTQTYYRATPSWFWEPIGQNGFNLPLMVIYTNGQTIPDEPRIVADMGIIYNGEGMLNYSYDPWNEYAGKISIEQRGESSSGFAKKSYSIELQNPDGTNNNVSILGLPIENDFVLYGPYSDKTMMKNVITYEIFNRMGRWAPKTRYIEVLLNGDYRGIYVLTEKIKRDDNRVDVDRITPDDITPLKMSGGYILRRDKKNDLDPSQWWQSTVNQPFHEQMWYQYFDPKREELTDEQALYIKDWMQNFDETTSSIGFDDMYYGYRQYIRVKSFIDLMMVNEISKGIDNYMFSTYFYKENDTDGGKLVAGPPWDYNLGYGNVNYGNDWDASETFGWCYPQWSRTYWFERLMEDPIYSNKVTCMWSDYRATFLSDESIHNLLDSCIAVMGDAIDRNFTKFPTLGQYIWPAKEPIPATYEGEVENLRTWLIGRLAWMDSQWLNKGTCTNVGPTDIVLDNNSVPENVSVGTLVGNLTVVDPDDTEHTINLMGGPGSTDNDKFTIDGNQLLSLEVFDSQVQQTYIIRVEAQDRDFETFQKMFGIVVSNELVTEINELETIQFTVYPNPTMDYVQLKMSDQTDNLTVKLFDLKGNLISDLRGNLDDINGNLIDVTGSLTQGLYIIRVNTNTKVNSVKFIKY